MSIETLVPYAQLVGSLSVPIAVLAIWQAWKLQHIIKAQDFWSTFIQKALDYPILAFPLGHAHLFDYANREIKLTRPVDMSDEDYLQLKRQEFERYEWFLSYLLKTARQILRWFAYDSYWNATIQRNIRYHAAYFAARKDQKQKEEKEARLAGRKLQRDFVYCSGRQVEKLIDAAIQDFREGQTRAGEQAKRGAQEEPAPAR